MKIKMILSAVCLFGILSTQAQKETKPWSVGFGIEGGIPTGAAHGTYDVNIGATARFSYLVGPGWATFTTGGIIFAPKTMYNDLKAAAQIPFKAGYKYKIAGPLFIMGELGYSVYQDFFENNNGDVVKYSTGGFTYAPSIGVTHGVFEGSIKYEAVMLSGNDLSYVNLRLAFNF